ncbi:MAG: hypothetical protein LBN10_07830 [Propionibacteriaceae bacterium]|jgi:hypothetical protein|nr:hypothetical protein [Propionibacteriaceae bacterium]
MGKWLKRVVVLLVVAFIVFFVISRPADSAHAVQAFFGGIKDAFWAVYDFFATFGR